MEVLEIETDFPELPKGYFYVGGVARYALNKLLRRGVQFPADVDAYFIEGEGNWNPNLWKEYEDWFYQKEGLTTDFRSEPSIEDVMNTRDFTFNEILYDGKMVYITRRALDDMKNAVVRPTSYERWKATPEDDGDWEPGLSPRTFFRAFRFASEMGFNVEGIKDEDLDVAWRDWHSARLQLDKAIGKGRNNAFRYFELLQNVPVEEDDSVIHYDMTHGSVDLYDYALFIKEQSMGRFWYWSELDKWFDIEAQMERERVRSLARKGKVPREEIDPFLERPTAEMFTRQNEKPKQ